MFKVEFTTSNAAFDGHEATECARILRRIAAQLERGELDGHRRDGNPGKAEPNEQQAARNTELAAQLEELPDVDALAGRVHALEAAAELAGAILEDSGKFADLDARAVLRKALEGKPVVETPVLRAEIYAATESLWTEIDRVCGPGVDWEWISNRVLSFVAAHGLSGELVQHLARVEEYERAEEDGTLCVSCGLRPARETQEDCDECHAASLEPR